jgi:iron complex outermembrane receptor protein
MILWKPGAYSYWIAENIGKVNASGLESVFAIKYRLNRLDARLNAGYSFTRSVSGTKADKDNVKQLMYIPENQANGSIHITYGDLYLFWITNYTGKRYITPDNSVNLPGYVLNNIVTGLKLDLRKTTADINFKVENLFNQSYQTIAWHPQPGRSYFISLSVQIIK